MKYRAEIDGLRALAVVPVILFHAGYEVVSGGFVGVDVFFVISGFLITSIIISEISQNRFSIVKFYERRARRILPALFCVMFVCSPLAYLTLPPDLLENFGQSLIATTLSANNILILMTSGYWEAEAELKPLLHTWSLAVEEQYYLIFPLLVMLLYARSTALFGLVLCAIFAASLVLAEYYTQVNPRLAFLMIFTRAWELMLGSLAALYLFRNPRPMAVQYQQMLSAAGLVLILYAILAFDYGNRMPGLWALLPTVGTFLIILYANQGTFAHRLLSMKPMVMIGLISYSAYLWHQPIFAFMRTESIWYGLNEYHFFVASVASLLLGYVSWRYVEQPFRDRTRISARGLTFSALLSAGLLVAVGAVFHVTNGMPVRVADYARPTLERSPCTSFVDDICVYGDAANLGVGVYGDSHADALSPAFSALAQETGTGIAYLASNGCAPLLGVSVALGNPANCRQIAQDQLALAKSAGLKTVFLIARWSLYVSGDYSGKKDSFFLTDDTDLALSAEASAAVLTRALRQTVEAYTAAGIRPVIVLQPPQQPYRVDYFYFQVKLRRGGGGIPPDLLAERSISTQKHLALQSANRAIIGDILRETQAVAVNLDPIFCLPDAQCWMGTEDAEYYSDDDHLSRKGALLTVDRFKAALKAN